MENIEDKIIKVVLSCNNYEELFSAHRYIDLAYWQGLINLDDVRAFRMMNNKALFSF